MFHDERKWTCRRNPGLNQGHSDLHWAISADLCLVFTLKLRSLKKTQTLTKSGNWILEPIHKRLYCIYGKFLSIGGLAQMVERALSMREVAGSTPASSTYSLENIFTFTDKNIEAWIAWA